VRIPRCAIAGAIVSAIFIVGCGDGDEAKPVDLKGTTDTSNFKGMIDQQKNDLKGPKPPKAQPKP
jgi:hypothetical protein